MRLTLIEDKGGACPDPAVWRAPGSEGQREGAHLAGPIHEHRAQVVRPLQASLLVAL